MKRFLRIGILLAFLFGFFLPHVLLISQAQTLEQFFDFGNYPVDYDQPVVIGRGYKSPDSIDECLKRKEYFFNEIHNIWVEGLERCEFNSKGILSRATYQGVSADAADEQACVGKREGQILVHGVPSESEARRWSERCSYLGTVGGAGPISTDSSSSPSSSSSYFDASRSGSRTSSTSTSTSTGLPTLGVQNTSKLDQDARARVDRNNRDLPEGSDEYKAALKKAKEDLLRDYPNEYKSTSTDTVKYESVYTGKGVQVPDVSLVASGISKEKSLIQLIVFYTNATLPYVSVISIFVFVSAGLFYILSFTSEDLHTKAKTMMIYVVIGILIIFSAYTIVNTLLAFSSFS